MLKAENEVEMETHFFTVLYIVTELFNLQRWVILAYIKFYGLFDAQYNIRVTRYKEE